MVLTDSILEVTKLALGEVTKAEEEARQRVAQAEARAAVRAPIPYLS